jgi:hypothetical protein
MCHNLCAYRSSILHILPVALYHVGSDGSIGIATRYELDDLRIESQWGERFSAPVQTGPGAHPASCTMGTGSLSRGKGAEAWRWSPTPSSAEVKERVELYLYSPSGSSWQVIGWTLPLVLCHMSLLFSAAGDWTPVKWVKDGHYRPLPCKFLFSFGLRVLIAISCDLCVSAWWFVYWLFLSVVPSGGVLCATQWGQ